MISLSGTITTVAGTGAPCMAVGTCGDGGAATAATLSGASRPGDRLSRHRLVADTGDNEIRAFTVGGTMTKIAGGGACAGPPCGDGSTATNASLSAPGGVAVAGGTVYVADTVDNEIRAVVPGGNIHAICRYGLAVLHRTSLQ